MIEDYVEMCTVLQENPLNDNFNIIIQKINPAPVLNHCPENGKVLMTLTDLRRFNYHFTNEPRHEKTNVLHMRKQRRRSASR